jgi:hypothetical protein
MQLAAALVCCLGIGLLIRYQRQTTTIAHTHAVATVAPVSSPEAAIAVDKDITPKEETTVLPGKVMRTARGPETTLAAVPKEQVPVHKNGPLSSEHKAPVVLTEQPVTQQAEAPQLAVMYLSDLDKENAAVPMSRKSRESGRVARYVKSNLEEYASSLPPRVVINQILSK